MKPTRAQRLNKIISSAGIASRRKADDLIKSGRVRLNGELVREPGNCAVWGEDSIKVDGREVPAPSERIYIMLNKPFGYLSALKDPGGRPIVTQLLGDLQERVYPVGRLDFDSLGLLLLTNDGEWAHRLTHPRFRVPKTYKVALKGGIVDTSLGLLRKGIELEDGFTGAAKITLLQRDGAKSLLRMTITSGRSRVIRRMMEAVGYKVIHLKRTGFGSLELGNLKIGAFRHLETQEIAAMKKMVGLA